MSLQPPFHTGPLAVVIGCGDLSMSSARLLGRRHPLLISDIDPERLAAAGSALRGEGYAVAEAVCDVTDARDVARLADAARPAGVRVLAHVAALAPSSGDFRKLMNVNLIGPHLTAEALTPLSVPGAAAVFVSSSAAFAMPWDAEIDALVDEPLRAGFLDRLEAALGAERVSSRTAYVLSKYALNRWCERLAVRLGPVGVRALSVSPGLILSSMGARERVYSPVSRTYAGETPLRREASLPEAAAVIDFVASDAASFLTGVDILVDGGRRAALRWPAKV